jgi:hypothetical protein
LPIRPENFQLVKANLWTTLIGGVNVNNWLRQLFKAGEVAKGNIVRRKKSTVEKYTSMNDLLAEVRRRNFHLIETGEQVIVCNDGFFKVVTCGVSLVPCLLPELIVSFRQTCTVAPGRAAPLPATARSARPAYPGQAAAATTGDRPRFRSREPQGVIRSPAYPAVPLFRDSPL